MVHTLMSATRLLDSSAPQTLTSNPAVEVENQRVTISPLSTRFGVNFKGQLAAVVLFTIADGDADAIRTGWSDVFQDRRERAPSPPSTLAAVTNVPGAESFSCLAQPCGRSQRHGQSRQIRSRSHDDVPRGRSHGDACLRCHLGGHVNCHNGQPTVEKIAKKKRIKKCKSKTAGRSSGADLRVADPPGASSLLLLLTPSHRRGTSNGR